MKYAFFEAHSHLHDKVFHDDREKLLEEMKGCEVAVITEGRE